jgi:hypothetical protein
LVIILIELICNNLKYRISDVEEVPDPSASKSPSHSTVLSGTFQEVCIAMIKNRIMMALSLDISQDKNLNFYYVIQ